MTDIASENQSFFNSIIGNTTERTTAKLITFYKTFGSPGLIISKAQVGSYIAIVNDSSSQGRISPFKFLVPCLSVRVKFTNQ